MGFTFGCDRDCGCLKGAVDLPGDVSFQAAHDLLFALTFCGAFLDVFLGLLVVAHTN